MTVFGVCAVLVFRCFHRVCGTRREHLGIGLQGFHDFGDAALKLRVTAVDDGGCVVFDDDVGIDPMPLDHPLACNGAAGGFRHKYLAAIKERAAPPDPYHTSPSAFPD